MKNDHHILARWMKIHGKTVDEVAEAVGCAPCHIRNLLAGRKDASLRLAKRISNLSGGVVPLDAFLQSESYR